MYKIFLYNMKLKLFLSYVEISKISWKIGPGRHAMSVGAKNDVLGVFRENKFSHTFLVLGPIDLTNGKAGVVKSVSSTLRGIKLDN
jgi:hypothetical protein